MVELSSPAVFMGGGDGGQPEKDRRETACVPAFYFRTSQGAGGGTWRGAVPPQRPFERVDGCRPDRSALRGGDFRAGRRADKRGQAATGGPNAPALRRRGRCH